MTTDQMRYRLADAYPGPRWRLRVMQMPENQVIAVYKNMSETDRFTKKKRFKREPAIAKAVQLTIFDLPEMKSI